MFDLCRSSLRPLQTVLARLFEKLRSHGTLTPHFMVIVFQLAACPGGHNGMVRPPVWKIVGADDPSLCEISAEIEGTDRP